MATEKEKQEKATTVVSPTATTMKATVTTKNRRRSMLHGGLSTNGSYNFGIPTRQGAREFIEDDYGKESWRMKILDFLHRPVVSHALMVLLLLDVLMLFIELFLLTHFPSCSTIERNCISCCPLSNATLHGEADTTSNETEHFSERFLSEEDHHHSEESHVCEMGLEPYLETMGGCDPHKWGGVHKVETALFAFTLIILSTFFIELNLEMIALRPGIFFRQIFFTLDYVIVTVSLTVELTMHFLDEDSLAALVGILIFARVWRFIRIGHGIAEVTSELTHHQYEEILNYTRTLKEAAMRSGTEMPHCPDSVQKALEEESTSHPNHNSSGEHF